MKLRPSPGRCLIKAEIAEDISDGGIVLPTDREGDPKGDPNIGTVIDIGAPLDGTVMPDVKIGDRVLFVDFITTRPPGKDENIYIVDFVDIAGVIEGEGPCFGEISGNEEAATSGPLDGTALV